MALEMKAIRRIVTGNDEAGNSTVIFDSDAPNVNVGTIAGTFWVVYSIHMPKNVCVSRSKSF